MSRQQRRWTCRASACRWPTRRRRLTALSHYWALIRREFGQNTAGREQTLALLAQAVFTLLLRNTALEDSANSVRGELQLFQRFNKMVDERFREPAGAGYAQALGVTESRLNDLCRRFANRPPKRLIFDRLLRRPNACCCSAPVRCMKPHRLQGIRPISPVFNRLEGCSPSTYRAAQHALS